MAKQRIDIDPADYPLPGNEKSPKQQYKNIRDDEELAARKDVRGSQIAAGMRLRQDAAQGRYANPQYGGDVGQFLMTPGRRTRTRVVEEYKKGGKVSASSRADGIAQRGKTRGKIL